MDEVIRTLLREYTEALQDYVANPDGARLRRVEDLGRRAVEEGHGTLELMGVHHEAAISVLFRPFSTPGAPPWTGLRMFCTTCPAWFRGPDQSAPSTETVDDYLRFRLPQEQARAGSLMAANAALRHVTEMLEQESKRIAHALHDEAGQLLTLVHLKLAEAAREVPAGCRSCFSEISLLLDRIENELRVLSHEVRPRLLDDAGLLPAIEFLAGGVARRTGMDIVLESAIDGRLPPEFEAILYSGIQEALANASRHSGAHIVRIALWEDTGVHCAIRDDGKGFNADEAVRRSGERGFGLAVMRERVEVHGGTLLILSRAGTGTEVLITLPRRAGNETAHCAQ